MPPQFELTILMPCLNEAETLAACIKKAKVGIERAGVKGEILIADNGSKDGSIEIAEKLGARVVHVKPKGYGNALRYGIEAALGKWIIMGDSDDSYDFSDINGFVEKLRGGDDLVMGCRLPKGGGTIMPGAMPWKNRWLGNPSLSFLGQLFFRSPAQDFHCGLRAFSKEAYDRMDLKTTGMEFASEMVIVATLKSMRISETPITLHKDGRSRPPHLKPWRDGWRHLRFMLIYSPRWLFLVPGLLLCLTGFILANLTYWVPFKIGSVNFDVGTLMVACMWMIIGVQFVALAFFTKVFAIAEGLLPDDPKFSRIFRIFTLEKGIVAGLIILLLGLGMLVRALWVWKQAGYGSLDYSQNLRRLIPAATLLVISVQTISSSFFMSVLGLKTTSRKPPAPPEAT
ncbi:glycosyltransferase family 2 protein [Pedosphaera parvula]|uniref:Glycosyl transferase family 2 n=1 Tax=Pedosphaera parvula (strain Ellin514) TaxID=320771 RepID=B9XKS9_PEDPL|nr:glycosyltransferase family 2 protein [Pedosphaera parvula]EEF59572.1 glycosyl transferase family 2 [Pedosphaera parvula Ellin514]